MEIQELDILGVYEIKLIKKSDSRGFFMRTFDYSLFNEIDVARNWVQENHSFTHKKNTIRGLHMQFSPYEETKLVRCIKGSILDVFVDLRYESKTFGSWSSIILNGSNMVYIPRGFAHGFCTLEDNCEVFYKVDNYYSPSKECGILWNDPILNINWPVDDPILSDKDKSNISFNMFKKYLK